MPVQHSKTHHKPAESSQAKTMPQSPQLLQANDELCGIVNRARGGDAEAFTQLVEQFRYAVYGIACAMLSNFEDAQDAAQEAFIKAWTGLPALRHASLFPAWLSRLTRNRCFDFARRIRLQRRSEVHPIEEVEDMPDSGRNHPRLIAERGETRDLVHAAIASLSEPNRLAVMLFYMGDSNIDEIAELLKTPAGTIKRRLHDSRKQLKARMMHMVEDTIKSNRLPDDFTRQTVEKAIEEARALIGERKMVEAEEKLRGALEKIPNHTGALQALNCALMGQARERGRWEILPEIVAYGRAIIASGEADEAVYAQTARTLISIPAIAEAAAFIEEWIRARGANLENLTMLAWVLGCLSRFEEAERVWEKAIPLVRTAPLPDVEKHVGYGCLALVECLSTAGEQERATRIAASGLKAWRMNKIPFPNKPPHPYANPWLWPWCNLLYIAGLKEECSEIARAAYEAPAPEGINSAGIPFLRLASRAWFDDPKAVISDYDRELKNAAAPPAYADCLISAFFGMRKADELLEEAKRLASSHPDKNEPRNQLWPWWGIVDFPINRYLLNGGNLEMSERLLHEAIAAGCEQIAGWGRIDCLAEIAVRRGQPSPDELMQQIEEKPPVSPYLYHQAREAAAAGEPKKAFEYLRKALIPFYNPPTMMLTIWEKDARWGVLREAEEFKDIFEDARKRFGMIRTMWRYLPEWQ